MSPMVKTREYTPTLTSIIPKARKQQACEQRASNVGPCGDLFSPPAPQSHSIGSSSSSGSSMGLQGILSSLPAWNTHRPHLTGYDIIEVSHVVSGVVDAVAVVVTVQAVNKSWEGGVGQW